MTTLTVLPEFPCYYSTAKMCTYGLKAVFGRVVAEKQLKTEQNVCIQCQLEKPKF